MLFKSYLKSSKKHISFCVNKSQNHTNRFGKASHFVLAIVSDCAFRGMDYLMLQSSAPLLSSVLRGFR